MFPDIFQEDCAYSTEEVMDFEPYEVKYPDAISTTAEAPKSEPVFNGSKPKIATQQAQKSDCMKPAPMPAPAAIPETKKEEVKAETQIISQPAKTEPAEEDHPDIDDEIEAVNNQMDATPPKPPEPAKKVLVEEKPKIQFAGNKPNVVSKPAVTKDFTGPGTPIIKTVNGEPAIVGIEPTTKKPVVSRPEKVKAKISMAAIKDAKADPKNQLDSPVVNTAGKEAKDYYASTREENDLPSKVLLETLKEAKIDYMQTLLPIRMGILKQQDWKSECELIWACLEKRKIADPTLDLEQLDFAWRMKMKDILEQLSAIVGNDRDTKSIFKKLNIKLWPTANCMWAVNYLRARKLVDN
jgi:hypothetical protein